MSVKGCYFGHPGEAGLLELEPAGISGEPFGGTFYGRWIQVQAKQPA